MAEKTGFWSKYEDLGGLKWINGEEKKVLIDEAVALPVLAVKFRKDTRFGDQYVLVTKVEGDDETRAISFSAESVESRDRTLEALKSYLEEEGTETPHVVLKKVERSIILVDPDADQQ